MRLSAPVCNLISAVTAASIGFLTLASLFATTGFPEVLTAFFLQSVVVTAAIGLLIGLVNLFGVHLGRLIRFEKGFPYSLIILVAASGVILLRVFNIRTSDTDEAVSTLVFEALQISLESALAGLMFFFLLYAAYKMLHRRLTAQGVVFMLALLVALIGWIPMTNLELLRDLRAWVLEVPAMGGARGLLIGIAMGTVVAGIRVLIGQDQAYREQ